MHPRVKKAFFANLAAGIQCMKEAKRLNSTDRTDPTVLQTVMRQLSHARTVLSFVSSIQNSTSSFQHFLFLCSKRFVSLYLQVLLEAQTMVPSCPVVNLNCALVLSEMAHLKGESACDSLFDISYQLFQNSIDSKPMSIAYKSYAKVKHTFSSQTPFLNQCVADTKALLRHCENMPD